MVLLLAGRGFESRLPFTVLQVVVYGRLSSFWGPRTTHLREVKVFKSVPPRKGVLRTQTLRTLWWGAQGYQRFPLSKPGVGI